MRNRRGFTLIELMVSMMILLIITGAAVQFMRRQSNLVARETTRMDALQNAQFATTQLERELRAAGVGVVNVQPMIVQLDSEAITFNANIVSTDTGDVMAVYQMLDADPNGARGMRQAEAVALPNSSPVKLYPDTTYLAAVGVPSSAETISYWLRKDSASALPNRYVLFRRVNALTPTVVARGLIKDPTVDTIPFLTYYLSDTLGRLSSIPKKLLPIYHSKVHGASSDTGRAAITDSVRAVRLHFLAAARDPRAKCPAGKPNCGDATRTVEVLVRLMNSGLLQRTTCGQPPITPGTPTAVSSIPGAPVKTVTLTWAKSGDDGGGEKDVERYAIYRRLTTDPSFGEPISSVPGSAGATYSFVDTQVQANVMYIYGIVAQDCTPQMSGISLAAPVFVLP